MAGTSCGVMWISQSRDKPHAHHHTYFYSNFYLVLVRPMICFFIANSNSTKPLLALWDPSFPWQTPSSPSQLSLVTHRHRNANHSCISKSQQEPAPFSSGSPHEQMNQAALAKIRAKLTPLQAWKAGPGSALEAEGVWNIIAVWLWSPIVIGQDVSVVEETFSKAMRPYTIAASFSFEKTALQLPEQAQPAPQRNTEAISSKCPGDLLFAVWHPEKTKNLGIITAEATKVKPFGNFQPWITKKGWQLF